MSRCYRATHVPRKRHRRSVIHAHEWLVDFKLKVDVFKHSFSRAVVVVDFVFRRKGNFNCNCLCESSRR